MKLAENEKKKVLSKTDVHIVGITFMQGSKDAQDRYVRCKAAVQQVLCAGAITAIIHHCNPPGPSW